MSRIKELRKVVGSKLRESITDAEKLESAYAHLYGVSLAATVIAEKRGDASCISKEQMVLKATPAQPASKARSHMS